MRNLSLTLVVITLGILACESPQNDTSVSFRASEEFKEANLPFSEVVIVGNVMYLSGQVGSSPGDVMKLVDGGTKEEARQALENIKSVLERNGSSMENVVKCTVMLADISEWGDFNSEYIKFFPNEKPARSAFATNGLALGARVEIECIAVLKR